MFACDPSVVAYRDCLSFTDRRKEMERGGGENSLGASGGRPSVDREKETELSRCEKGGRGRKGIGRRRWPRRA